MKLNKEAFKEPLGSWYSKIEPLFDNGVMDDIFSFLKRRSKEGYKVLPESKDTFRCFRETPISSLNAMIVGLSPYHTMIDNLPVADGLMMSCSNTGIIAPSLEKFYDGIEMEYGKGLDLNMVRDPDLKYLANQGILLYNIGLTTEVEKAGAHTEIWKPFTKYLLEDVISLTGVPVVFLGDEAAKYKRWLGPLQPYFTLKHPASASYRHSQWDSKGVFKMIETIVMNNNGIQIKWAKDGRDK
jgi:uracil DNA glycosylase